MSYTTINKSSLHFNTKLYTGNGGTNAITGVGFQPDWVWIKNRSSAQDHQIYDAVRGVNKKLESNNSEAEATLGGGLQAFGTDGFTLGDHSESNDNGDSYVSWDWKANGAGSANSDGATASTVSVNSTAGFSIVKWTGTGSGTTIGHGLGAKPKIIFVKNRSSATNWVVNVGEIVGADERSLRLNSTNAIMADAAQAGGYTYNNQATTFQTANGSNGNQNDVNQSGNDIIAYCFKEVAGYSSFGTYTGNGNADGPFIYTGFKPAFVLMKRYGSTGNWVIQDNRRSQADPGNPANRDLNPSNNEAEEANNGIDLYANGFKQVNTDGDSNAGGSGNTYIYMAFAAAPLVGSNNVPATAR